MKNHFYAQVEKAYAEGANVDELKTLLGRGRAKKGMFEGDIVEGELEIGQIAGLIDEIIPAKAIVDEIITSYRKALNDQKTEKYTF
jgi:enoyl-[acyl-carrier protein] reductase II